MGGAHAVGGHGQIAGVVEQDGMHLDDVERRSGRVLEVLFEDRQVQPPLDDELGLLEHLASCGLERLLTRFDAPTRQRPASERGRLRALDPDVPVGAAEDAECDARGGHAEHGSGPRSRW